MISDCQLLVCHSCHSCIVHVVVKGCDTLVMLVAWLVSGVPTLLDKAPLINSAPLISSAVAFSMKWKKVKAFYRIGNTVKQYDIVMKEKP